MNVNKFTTEQKCQQIFTNRLFVRIASKAKCLVCFTLIPVQSLPNTEHH